MTRTTRILLDPRRVGWPALLRLLLAAAVFLPITPAKADIMDTLAPYRAGKDQFIAGFRESGRMDPSPLTPVAKNLTALVNRSEGELRARALLELGSVQRMQNGFAQSIATMTQAAETAAGLGLSDVEFDAWIGVARAQLLGNANHGAAAAAFERAASAAGAHPTAKQRYDLVAYQADLLLGRGEVEAGLVEALQAVQLAPAAGERFFAELDIADGLQKLAESCDYRKLRFTESDDAGDGWNGCRRAVSASVAAYEKARQTALQLGWAHLATQMREFQQSLQMRLQLIELRARAEKVGEFAVFSPRSANDVLVNRYFASGASDLTEWADLAKLSESVVDASDARTGHSDARSLYLRGLIADIRGGKTDPVEFFAQAATLLAAERGSFFDPRRRGTAIENRAEIVRDLALRLLAHGREAEAFAAFESARARGLGEIAQLLALPNTTDDDRTWLSTMLRLEAEASEAESAIVRDLITNAPPRPTADRLAKLQALRGERAALLRANDAARQRFSSSEYSPASLSALRAAADRAGIPVMLYWAAPTNVVVWYIGPHGSDVRTVFLPESVLIQKTQRLLNASKAEHQQFDETAARELFLYLVAPFQDLLDGRQVLIVPQGPLTGLPFEMLIDPANGTPLIERWAVSYAPNATMALRALQRPSAPIGQVTAVVDVEIDGTTEETQGIAAAGALRQPVLYAADILPDKLGARLAGSDGLHLLLHGEFESDEPLLSTLGETRRGSPRLLAADLVGLPLRGMRIAVLSACESGRLGTRISNEIYGFPWALLAGGVETVVVSRWRVDGNANSTWMRAFYQAANSGAPLAEAAATAMKEMRKAGFSNPHYWAAMQVISG